MCHTYIVHVSWSFAFAMPTLYKIGHICQAYIVHVSWSVTFSKPTWCWRTSLGGRQEGLACRDRGCSVNPGKFGCQGWKRLRWQWGGPWKLGPWKRRTFRVQCGSSCSEQERVLLSTHALGYPLTGLTSPFSKAVPPRDKASSCEWVTLDFSIRNLN